MTNSIQSETVTSIENIGRWKIIGLFLAIATLPLFLAEVLVLLDIKMYQFVPLVYLFAGYWGYRRWERARDTRGPRANHRSWGEAAWIAICYLALIVHAGMFGPWLGGFAGICAIGAGICILRRLRDVQLWDLWVLVVVSMRLPLDLQKKLAAFLQSQSAILSSFVLDLLYVPHIQLGNTLEIPIQQLFVDEACSGIVSIVSVMSCSLLIAILNVRSFLHTILLFGIGILSALLMNVSRITIIVVLRHYWDIDLSSGWPHDLLGMCTFSFALFLMWSADHLFDYSFVALQDRGLMTQILKYQLFPENSTRRRDKYVSATDFSIPAKSMVIPVALLGCLIGSYHGFVFFQSTILSSSDSQAATQQFLSFDRPGFVATIEGWKLSSGSFEEREIVSELGRYSQVMIMVADRTSAHAVISIDFPFFRRWHDVSGCYQNSGWDLVEKQIFIDQKTSMPCIAADFRSNQGNYGFLLFANIDETGLPIQPPNESFELPSVVQSILRRYRHSRQLSLNPKMLYQLQVWTQTTIPLTEEERAERYALFAQALATTRAIIQNSK